MWLFRWRQPKKGSRLGNYLWELKHRTQSEILPSDVVKFSEPLRTVFNQATRDGQIKFSDICKILELPPEQAQQVIDDVIEKGFLHPTSPLNDEPVYEARPAVRTRRKDDVIPKDILKKLDDL